MQLSKLNERKMKNQSFRFAFIFSLRLFDRWPVVRFSFTTTTAIAKYFAYNKKLFVRLPMGKCGVVCSQFVEKNVANCCSNSCGDRNDGKCLNCKLYKTLMLRMRACSFFSFIFFMDGTFSAFYFFVLWSHACRRRSDIMQ